MDSFFLSKLIEGEAKGAKGCAPHSVQPRMPPSCSCTLLFVCPLCAQSREGVGHCLRVWVHAPVCLPPLHIHGDGAPLPCPCSLPFACCPCTQARGRWGRSFPVYAHPRLHVALRAKQREGGATSGFAPRLSAWRTNGEGPAPLPHAPCSHAASAQKPRWGGVGLHVAPSLHGPFACNWGHAGSHSHAATRLRVAPVCKLGEEGGPPCHFWDWVWPSRVAIVCKRGKEGQRGGFPFRHGPILATPSQLHAPPRVVRTWDKKAPPIHVGSPCLVCALPWPSVPRKGGAKGVQRGCKGGSAHPLPVLTCTPSPVAPLLCMWRMGYVGKPGGGGAHKVGAARQ